VNKDDLKIAGETLFGSRWQTAMARWLGMKDARSVRRWAAGDTPVPPGVETQILERLKAPRLWPAPDAWILGTGPSGRRYVIHSQIPRFVATIVPAEEETVGYTWTCADGRQLAYFAWTDPALSGVSLRNLMLAAEAAADIRDEV
jgi:hypothetical protein